MEDLPLGRISAFVPEFAVKDLPLGRTLMMMSLLSSLFPNIIVKVIPQVSYYNQKKRRIGLNGN